MVKLIVIGIDAQSWNLIEPWVNEGKLPNIKKLMEKGVWGDLESCIYYYTSPAWKCYSTSKNPGKLGAFGRWSFDKTNKRISLVSSTSFKGKELWDILGEYGYKCGIVNMPLTYPPKKINGVMITGPPDPEKGCTYPPELEKEIKKYNHRINPKFEVVVDRDRGLSEMMDLIKNNFLIGARLLKEYDFDFFQLVIFYTDIIQHVFWKQMEEGDSKYKYAIEDCWKLVDSKIGSLLGSVDEDCYTFMMSDHGQTALRGVFRLNLWLELKGYIHFKGKNPMRNTLNSLTFYTLYKIENPALKFALNSLMKFITALSKKTRLDLVARERLINIQIQSICWEKTKAVCSDANCMYITTNFDYKKIRDRLIEEIKNLRDPNSGEKVVEDVKRKEEVFKGRYLHLLPDLIIIPKKGYYFSPEYSARARTTEDIWDFSRDPWSAAHRLHGAFLACGPGIKRGKKIDKTTIYDLVPTILHIFGVPIPQDVDGRVLLEIFEEDSDLAKRRVIYERKEKEDRREKDRDYYSKEEEEKIGEKLRGLGYLG